MVPPSFIDRYGSSAVNEFDVTIGGNEYPLAGLESGIGLRAPMRPLCRITLQMSRVAKWRFPCSSLCKGSDTLTRRLHLIVRRQSDALDADLHVLQFDSETAPAACRENSTLIFTNEL